MIAIIGILVALLLPAVQAAREAARRGSAPTTSSRSAWRMHNFASANADAFPPGRCNTPYNYGWTVFVLEYSSRRTCRQRFDKNANFYDAVNQPVVQTPLSVFECPSDPGGTQIFEMRTSPRPMRPSVRRPTGAASDYFACYGVWDASYGTPFSATGCFRTTRSARLADHPRWHLQHDPRVRAGRPPVPVVQRQTDPRLQSSQRFVVGGLGGVQRSPGAGLRRLLHPVDRHLRRQLQQWPGRLRFPPRRGQRAHGRRVRPFPAQRDAP